MEPNKIANSVVCTREIPEDKVTYQVRLQLFVVGDDAVVDDDKLWEKEKERVSESE